MLIYILFHSIGTKHYINNQSLYSDLHRSRMVLHMPLRSTGKRFVFKMEDQLFIVPTQEHAFVLFQSFLVSGLQEAREAVSAALGTQSNDEASNNNPIKQLHSKTVMDSFNKWLDTADKVKDMLMFKLGELNQEYCNGSFEKPRTMEELVFDTSKTVLIEFHVHNVICEKYMQFQTERVESNNADYDRITAHIGSIGSLSSMVEVLGAGTQVVVNLADNCLPVIPAAASQSTLVNLTSVEIELLCFEYFKQTQDPQTVLNTFSRICGDNNERFRKDFIARNCIDISALQGKPSFAGLRLAKDVYYNWFNKLWNDWKSDQTFDGFPTDQRDFDLFVKRVEKHNGKPFKVLEFPTLAQYVSRANAPPVEGVQGLELDGNTKFVRVRAAQSKPLTLEVAGSRLYRKVTESDLLKMTDDPNLAQFETNFNHQAHSAQGQSHEIDCGDAAQEYLNLVTSRNSLLPIGSLTRKTKRGRIPPSKSLHSPRKTNENTNYDKHIAKQRKDYDRQKKAGSNPPFAHSLTNLFAKPQSPQIVPMQEEKDKDLDSQLGMGRQATKEVSSDLDWRDGSVPLRQSAAEYFGFKSVGDVNVDSPASNLKGNSVKKDKNKAQSAVSGVGLLKGDSDISANSASNNNPQSTNQQATDVEMKQANADVDITMVKKGSPSLSDGTASRSRTPSTSPTSQQRKTGQSSQSGAGVDNPPSNEQSNKQICPRTQPPPNPPSNYAQTSPHLSQAPSSNSRQSGQSGNIKPRGSSNSGQSGQSGNIKPRGSSNSGKSGQSGNIKAHGLSPDKQSGQPVDNKSQRSPKNALNEKRGKQQRGQIPPPPKPQTDTSPKAMRPSKNKVSGSRSSSKKQSGGHHKRTVSREIVMVDSNRNPSGKSKGKVKNKKESKKKLKIITRDSAQTKSPGRSGSKTKEKNSKTKRTGGARTKAKPTVTYDPKKAVKEGPPRKFKPPKRVDLLKKGENPVTSAVGGKGRPHRNVHIAKLKDIKYVDLFQEMSDFSCDFQLSDKNYYRLLGGCKLTSKLRSTSTPIDGLWFVILLWLVCVFIWRYFYSQSR